MTAQAPFEERLLRQLKHAVDERPHRRPGRGKLLAGAGVTLATVLGIGIPTLTAGTAAAFEVTKEGGSVHIEIKELSDAEGLEEALAKYGYKADVTYLPWGKKCAGGRFTQVTGGAGDRGNGITGDGITGLDDELQSFTIELTDFDPDHTLVIELSPLTKPESTLLNLDSGGVVGAAAGEVAECEVVDVSPEFIWDFDERGVRDKD